MAPKVSVILPTCNCAGYLMESVPSVLSQTFGDLELLIIDDGSSDGTEELVKKKFVDPRVKYFKIAHAGLSAARNNGLKNAQGELLAFLDADDIFLPDKIEKELAAFEKDRAAGFVYSSERYFFEDRRERLYDSPYEKFSGDLFIFLKRSNFIHVSTVMVRRGALKGLIFDTGLKSHEDWDFFLRLSAKGLRFFFVPEPLTLVRVRKTSMTAVSPVMDSSRKIVGERARALWKDMKRRSLLRYLFNRVRAAAVGFPDAGRFNKPPIIPVS